MRVLIVYGSFRGQTAKIAHRIARFLSDLGHEADVKDGRSLPADLDLTHYDAVIRGASVIAGQFQQYIVDFVVRRRDQLQQMPTALFSVSLTEADPDPGKHARARQTITRFLDDTGWQPQQIASFAGSMAYLRYRWLMRLIWRRIALPGAHERATPAAHEYTDWDAVARFATEFATHARAARRSQLAS